MIRSEKKIEIMLRVPVTSMNTCRIYNSSDLLDFVVGYVHKPDSAKLDRSYQ